MKKLIFALMIATLSQSVFAAATYQARLPLDGVKKAEVTKPVDPDTHGVRTLSSPISGKNIFFRLTSGYGYSGTVSSMPKGTLEYFAIYIANYANTSDGTLTLKLCASAGCSSSVMPVSKSVDNDFFIFNLANKLAISKNDTITYTLTLTGSSNPPVVWVYPAAEKPANVSIFATSIGFPGLKVKYTD